jgi:hypothetical protein
MSRAPAYNENQYRDYPFITVVQPIDSNSSASALFEHLPSAAIVDFGCIMDLDANFSEGDYVYLDKIERDGAILTFYFGCTSNTEQLIFARDTATAAEWEIQWVESEIVEGPSYDSQIEDNVEVPVCRTEGAWRGFLVTGKFDELLTLIADGDTLTFATGLWQIEPSKIQNIYKHYVRSVTVLNRKRTLVTDETVNYGVVVYDACLNGNLKFREGYNCSILQNDAANQLIFKGAVGAGQGEPCAEVSLSIGEVPPDDGSYLTGGPRCGDVLKTINGKGGKSITIKGGPGFTVEADPETSTLTITRDLSQFTKCGSNVT